MNSRTLRQRRARHYIVALAACLLTLLTTPVTAQPRLAVEPDTLFYSNQRGADNNVYLWNEGADTLRIDSLRFSTFTVHGWGLELCTELVLPDTTYDFLRYAFGELDYPETFPEASLPPQDTLRVKIIGFDGCLICGGASSKPGFPTVRDTLWIYTNDPNRPATLIPIDFARYVATDEPPQAPAPLTLQVYPNPFARTATLEIAAARPGRYAVTIYDVRGRQVFGQVLRVSERAVLEWPAVGLSSGLYLVQVSSDHARARRMVTHIR